MPTWPHRLLCAAATPRVAAAVGAATAVNGDDEADRLVPEWVLDSPRAERAAAGEPLDLARALMLVTGDRRLLDVATHLARVAVVNQTTLLMNETLAIIEHLRAIYRAKFGEAEAIAEEFHGRVDIADADHSVEELDTHSSSPVWRSRRASLMA